MTPEAEMRALKAKREIPPPPPPSLRATLEWLFDHAHELPRDNPSLLLKTVGNWWSLRMAESGFSSKWHGMYEELDLATSKKDTFTYDRRTKRLTNTRFIASPPELEPGGWMLKTITHAEQSSRINGGKYEYAYMSKRTGEMHNIFFAITHEAGDHYALFWLCGTPIIYYESHGPPDSSLIQGRFQFHSGFFLEARRQEIEPPPNTTTWEFEAVFPKAACYRYMYYDGMARSVAVDIHFPNSHRIDHYFLHNPDYGSLNETLQDIQDLKRLVNYDPHTRITNATSWESGQEIVVDFFNDLEYFANVSGNDHKPHLSALLTKRLHDRLWRMSRKLLLTIGLEREEIRGRDPIMRCAACAVQAAKDQLVLGLEPPAKRPRGA